MNKNILIKSFVLLSTLLTLASCNGTENSSSSKPVNNNSSTSSSFRDPASISSSSSSRPHEAPEVDPDDFTMTINEFSYFLQDTSYDLEAEESNSSTRKITQVEQQAYAIETSVIEETLTMYEGPYAIIEGTENITYKSTDDILTDDYEGFQPKIDTYTSFRGVYEGTFYQIDDYGKGKDRDYAGKLEINKEIMEHELDWESSTQAAYFVDYYVFDLFGIYLTDYYELVPNYVAETNELEYFIEFKDTTQDTYGIVYSTAELFFSMNTDGFITSYVYRYTEKAKDYNEAGQLGNEYLLYSITDEVTVNRGEKNTALETLPIVPTNYWLQSFDIQMVATLLDEEIVCPNDKIPAKYYVEARAVNIYPEKALDTDLIILESSDNEVIEVNQYGVVSSKKGGTTTLKIQSVGGINKTLEVSVFEESISAIRVELYSSHFYVGEKYGIYEYITPENAIDSIVWSIDNPEIAELIIDDRGYASLKCTGVGTVTITATSVKDPTVTGTKTIRITEKQNEETLRSLITAKEWTNIDSEFPNDVIRFNEDGTGSVTFTDLITYETVTADFGWQYSEYSEDEGLLIAFTTLVSTYDACFCILSLNGETLEVNFFHQDSSIWFYQYVGDFAQVA